MQLSNLALAYLLEEIRPVIEGSIVRKVQQVNPSGFKLKLQTREGTKDLVLVLDAFFLSGHTFPVEEKPGNFTLRLKKFLLNRKIMRLWQHKFERIVFIEFEGFSLALEMFHNGNLVLLDKDNTITDVLKMQEFSDRTLKRKEKYSLPPERGLDPLELTEKNLAEKFSESKKDAFHAFVSSVNIAPEIAEEVFFSQKIKKEKSASELSSNEIKKLVNSTKDFYTVSKNRLSPHKTEKSILAFPLSSLSKTSVPIASINYFLDDYYSSHTEQEIRKEQTQEKSTEKSKLEYKSIQQKTALETLSQDKGDSSLAGQKIYENYKEIHAILSTVHAMEKEKKPKQEILDFLQESLIPEWFKKIVSIDVKKKEIVLDL